MVFWAQLIAEFKNIGSSILTDLYLIMLSRFELFQKDKEILSKKYSFNHITALNCIHYENLTRQRTGIKNSALDIKWMRYPLLMHSKRIIYIYIYIY